MARVNMNFKGMDSVLKTIEAMGGNAEKAIEKALLECHELVTNQVNQEMARYKINSGEMKESILDENRVQWTGKRVSVKAGFNQKQSMHGTYMMITGTPYRKPDRQLYNAIYGAKTRKAIKEIQEKALMKVIEGGY